MSLVKTHNNGRGLRLIFAMCYFPLIIADFFKQIIFAKICVYISDICGQQNMKCPVLTTTLHARLPPPLIPSRHRGVRD